MSEQKHAPCEESVKEPTEPMSGEAADQTAEAEAQAPRREADREASEDSASDKPRRTGLFSHIRPRTLFFGTLAVVALICFVIAFSENFRGFIDRIFSVISPILIGCVLAYLCHPILNFYEYRLFRRIKNNSVRRGLSLFLTVITFFAIIVLFILLIVPELISSIQTFMTNYESYVASLLEAIRGLLTRLSEKGYLDFTPEAIDSMMVTLSDTFGSIKNLMATLLNLLSKSDIAAGDIVGNVSAVLMVVVNLLADTVLSLFIAFYILASKDKRTAQMRKFRRAMFTPKQDQKITEIVTLTDRTFSGFLFGILIDAAVVGVLTFILLSIFEVSSYNLLIAAIMAVTNIIPVFGPFIGAIPSAFIVLITNPSKLLLFILLMIIIQQVDGNILCPKIQGDNTGVSSLSVLIAITIAGSLWGLGGMVIGVPIFAVIIELGKRAIENRLKAKGEPTDTTVYYPRSALSNAEKDVYYDHAGLRYKYDHSRFKERVDNFRRKFLSIGNDPVDEPLDQASAEPNTTSAEAATSGTTDSQAPKKPKNQKKRKGKKKQDR